MNEMEIAAYLDGGLSLSAREQMEAHLAVCPLCRRDVSESRTLLRRLRRPRRIFVGMGLAAAAVLVITLPLTRRATDSQQSALLRSGVDHSALISYAPIGEVPITAIRFVWGGAREAVTYRLTITRSDAAIVWSSSGPDTAIALPVSLRLVPGQRYFWAADALLTDGSTRTTGLREFAPVP